MSISKNVFGLALGTILLAGAQTVCPVSVAMAASDDATEEVLFKIHDISPVKNRDGEVVACDFHTTFYNRSPNEINEAVVNLVWKDTSLENVINEEKNEDAQKRNRNANRAYSETERRTSTEVSTQVEISGLKSYKQVTLDNRINTDRCFMLLQQVDFSVKSCSAKGVTAAGRSNARRNNAISPCARMFKFVSPESEQYYLDFKEITLDEEKSKDEAQKREKMSQTDSVYAKTIEALNSANNALSVIK